MYELKNNSMQTKTSYNITSKFNDWCAFNATNIQSQLFGKIKVAGGKKKVALYTHFEFDKLGGQCSMFYKRGYFVQCNDECTIHYHLN